MNRKWNGQKVSEEFIAERERFASDMWKWLARNEDEVDAIAVSFTTGMGMGDRTPTNGQPYYCKSCGLAWSEYMACEEADCELESAETANERTSK